jgi:hypothetical protein
MAPATIEHAQMLAFRPIGVDHRRNTVEEIAGHAAILEKLPHDTIQRGRDVGVIALLDMPLHGVGDEPGATHHLDSRPNAKQIRPAHEPGK